MEIVNKPLGRNGLNRLVAKDGSIELGTLLWQEMSEDEAHILRLSVKQEHRRKGVATALIDAFRAQGHKYHSATKMTEKGASLWESYRENRDDVTADPRLREQDFSMFRAFIERNAPPPVGGG